MPTLSRYIRAFSSTSFGSRLQHGDRRLHHVLEDREVRPEVELLEHHRQVRADAGDLRPVGRVAGHALALPADGLALEQDLALLAVLEQVAQRRSVDLPEPDDPMSDTTCP
jgi:hypothetical protein